MILMLIFKCNKAYHIRIHGHARETAQKSVVSLSGPGTLFVSLMIEAQNCNSYAHSMEDCVGCKEAAEMNSIF